MKVIIMLFALSLGACATTSIKEFEISKESIKAGTSVKLGGKEAPLYAGGLKVGQDFISLAQKAGIKIEPGVAIVNIVPSIDTAVCEAQSHILGESKEISPKIKRFSISRDLPMAQERFAKDAKLTNITYFSDYKTGSFGKASGLLIKGPELLARAVLVLDKNGKIAYLQIVPDVVLMPDMAAAIDHANKLVR